MATPAAQRQERVIGVHDGQAFESGGTAQASPGTTLYDPLLTIEQVSDWLGVPKGTLYQWRSRNQGPRAIKVGGALRYRRSEVNTYLDRHTDSRSA